MLCRYLHSLSHQQWQWLSQRESSLPVWQCLCNGTLINPHDVIPSHNNVTDTGRAYSVIWPSYPGGKLTTAGCDSNFTLVNLLQCCYDGRTEGRKCADPRFKWQTHTSLIPAAFKSSRQGKRSLLGSKMWMLWFWIRLGFANPLIHHQWDETSPV